MATLGDWQLTVTGAIVRVDREDLDKSGRQPKLMLSFVIEPETLDAPPEATLPAELAIRIRDRELAQMIDAIPAPGDRVEMHARGNGPRPATLYLTAVRRI